MDNKQYSKLYNYIKDNNYIYIVIIKNKKVKQNEVIKDIVNAIYKIDRSKYLLADINFKSTKQISFQYVEHKVEHNSIVINKEYLNEALSTINITLIDAIKNQYVFPKTFQSIEEQRKRYIDKLQEKYNKILGNTKKSQVTEHFKDWIKDNKKRLVKSSTQSESILLYKLKKTFHNRIKAQTPFLIKGKCYYADLCIKSKKIIIEVDGGYHNTKIQKELDLERDKDFKSIGYETIRIKNEEVKDSKKVSELIQIIKNKKNKGYYK